MNAEFFHTSIHNYSYIIICKRGRTDITYCNAYVILNTHENTHEILNFLLCSAKMCYSIPGAQLEVLNSYTSLLPSQSMRELQRYCLTIGYYTSASE